MPAAEIRFEYLNGKPQLATEDSTRRSQFNVSHSENIPLIAVGGQYRVGVDVEKSRDLDTTSLAERFARRWPSRPLLLSWKLMLGTDPALPSAPAGYKRGSEFGPAVCFGGRALFHGV
jgi:hypothetical protein